MFQCGGYNFRFSRKKNWQSRILLELVWTHSSSWKYRYSLTTHKYTHMYHMKFKCISHLKLVSTSTTSKTFITWIALASFSIYKLLTSNACYWARVHKVDMPKSNTIKIQTPIFEWYVVEHESKSWHQKDMCWKEGGLCAHNMLIILFPRVEMIKRRGRGFNNDHLMKTRIITFMLNKIFMCDLESMRQMTTTKILKT